MAAAQGTPVLARTSPITCALSKGRSRDPDWLHFGLRIDGKRELAFFLPKRRANKIKLRLAGSVGVTELFPQKPKGMWWRTCERLQQQALEAELLADQAFAAQFQWMRSRAEAK